jgi:hypothetical protein
LESVIYSAGLDFPYGLWTTPLSKTSTPDPLSADDLHEITFG